eukprot:TRINITY_DN49_c0_g2_i1.p1 TRINITY_DN49_c0_g2~~TRINITY_DN49_c0_g2_i1.p1  ORF type:complete len:419 (+),score=88.75 TRINITY_DN49_c0_g2_i1:88-1344(+)
MAAVAAVLQIAAAAAISGKCDTGSCKWENPQPFNLLLAKRAVYQSAAAYCMIAKVEDWACGSNCDKAPGMQGVQVVSTPCPSPKLCEDTLVGLTGWDAQTQVVTVVFRGTDNGPNWASNVNTLSYAPYGAADTYGSVHKGFHQAWLGLKTAGMWRHIQELASAHPGRAVRVTGHSLGGALATLCARDVAAEMMVGGSKVLVELTSVASPRVGDAAFVRWMHGNLGESWRLTHNKDVVPHVPTGWMGFQHIGREVFSKGDGEEYALCDGSGEDPQCANACWQGLAEPGTCTSIEDHALYLGIGIGFQTGCDMKAAGANSETTGGTANGADGSGSEEGIWEKIKGNDIILISGGAGLLLVCAGVGWLAGRGGGKQPPAQRAGRAGRAPQSAEPTTPAAPWKELKEAKPKPAAADDLVNSV